MKTKLAAIAALTALAMTLSACLVINVERADKDGKADKPHAAAGQAT